MTADLGWSARLGPARYVSPSGVSIDFVYEDVKTERDAHTSAFNFPDAEGTYVQDLGRSGRRFPLRVIFTGHNHDLLANAFDAALGEPGVAVLHHPRYGRHKVVPFGKISREDRLKSQGNQAIFLVTFYETTDLLYPTKTGSAVADTKAALAAYEAAAPEKFASDMGPEIAGAAVLEQTFVQRLTEITQAVRTRMKSVVDRVDEIKRTFEKVATALTGTLDDLIGGPLLIAFQLKQLAFLPARTIASIRDRIDAYANLAQSIFSKPSQESGGSTDRRPVVKFLSDDLAATTMVMGVVETVLNSTFETRTEALETADRLLSLCDELTAWRDENLVTLELIDTGESYQHVTSSCALAAGFLVELSFTLKQERTHELDKPRTPLDAEARLYGTVDVNLDFLIRTNNLVGLELFEIPAGRVLKYYVEVT